MGGWGPPQGRPSPEKREIWDLEAKAKKLETLLQEKNEQDLLWLRVLQVDVIF